MGFAEINALHSELTSLKKSLSNYETKRSSQKKRKTEVESLIKVIKSVCNDNSDDVTSHIKKIINNLDEALTGVSSVSSMQSDATSDKEKDVYGDGKMNNALTQMESELRDVSNKISDYDSKISTKKTEISNCQAAIKREQRNVANGYKIKYDNAQWRYNQAKIAYEKEPTSVKLKQDLNEAKRNRDIAKNNYNKYKGWL